jgi:hypothetical protein
MSSSIDGLRVNQKIEFTLAYGNVLTDSNHTYFISSIEHDEDTLKNTITISDTLSGSIKSLDKILTTTSSSSNAGIVTIGFVTQPLSPYAIGQTVTITGIVSANYAGGTHVVTGCTTSSVSFASNIAVGSQTTPGTIQSKPLNNILTTTSSSSNAGIVTIGFPNQSSSPYVIGQTISITGIVSVNYTGGTHVVTDCTTSSVSFASNIAVGSQTTSGTIHAAGIINSTMSFTIKDFGMKYTVPSFVAANTYYEFKKYDTNRVSLSNAGTLPIVIGQSVTGNLVSPGTILLNLENRRTKTGNVTSTVLSNNTYWVKQDQTDPAFVFLDGNCYTSTDEFKIQDVKLNGNIAITSVNGGNVSNVTPGTMLTFTGLETKNTNSTKKIATLSKPVTIADDHYSFSNPHYDKLNVVNGDFITSNSVVSGTGISDSDTVTVSSVSGNVVTLSKPLTELASGEYTFTISEFKEGDQLNYNFMAKPAVKNDYVTYEIVTGNLPAGNLVLTSSNNSARLTGTLAQVATNAYSEFTIRASEYNGNTVVGISERTFDMTISGPTPPSFITGNGMLSDSNKLSQYANTPSLPIGNIYNSVKGVALKRPFSTTKSTTKIKVVATNFMLTGSKIKFVGPTFGGANVIADQVYYLNSIDSVNNEIEISLTSGGLSIIVDEDPYFVNSANKPEPNSMSFTVTGLNLIIDTTPYNVTNYNIANGTPVFIAGVNGTIQLNNNKFYTGNVDGANNRFNLFNSANLISSSVVTGNVGEIIFLAAQ